MNVFERYAPFIQDYIYRSGWQQLRGVQNAAGEAIFGTQDNVLLTASSGRMLLFNTGLIAPKTTKNTQGVAAMTLGKGAYAIHHSGKRYTDDNIGLMLMERHLAKKARRASAKHHLRGPAKFTEEDRQRFSAALEALILIATNENGGNTP